MPYAGGFAGRIVGCRAYMLFAVFLAVANPSGAKAQMFDFSWTGTLLGNTVTISAVLNATLIAGTEYELTSISNGTVSDATVGGGFDFGEGTPATISSSPSTALTGIVGHTNRFFFPTGGAAGANNNFNPTVGSGNSGFRIISSSGHEFAILGEGSTDRVIAFNGNASSGFTSDNSQTFSITQVPGPLAGAGMLSWLAVMVMSLVWRRRLADRQANGALLAKRVRRCNELESSSGRRAFGRNAPEA